MKTKIGMLLIAMCMSAMAFAQKPIEKTRVKKNFTPEQIAQKRTDIMKIRLQLNDEQTAKIYTWNLQQIKEQIAQKEKEKIERQKRMEQRKAQEAEFISILTPSQKAAYDQWKQEQKKEMRKKNLNKRLHPQKNIPHKLQSNFNTPDDNFFVRHILSNKNQSL